MREGRRIAEAGRSLLVYREGSGLNRSSLIIAC